MNINELGQLFITGFDSITLSEEEGSFLETNNIGGVILFSRNYQDPAQLAELVNSIQTRRDEYPLFVSVDQEGGRVKRFKDSFIQLPSMLTLGKNDSPKLTFELHQAMATELAACGINLDYSPTCDIWTNPKNTVIGDRAFGDNADLVERHVSAAIRGLHAGNVIACAKHFPGHGNTTKDSHFDLPYVKANMDQLEKVELKPFMKAAKSRVEFMMMAHLIVDAIDPDLPCTLSKKAYDFCREKLKYKKLMITDDMEMHAITKHFSVEEAAIKALEAGADILLYRSMDQTRLAFKAVKDAVRNGRLKLKVIEEKIERVKACKKAHFKSYEPIYIPSIAKVLNSETQNKLLGKINLEA
ncbi:MAG: beta-N-acetylhexosaminidase [Halobacteriovoraceae bacterium]|nr:beta-N-acetylhexosaminidase [Halobacteriovoraceae bacterium]